jgi:hypothetical protein
VIPGETGAARNFFEAVGDDGGFVALLVSPVVSKQPGLVDREHFAAHDPVPPGEGLADVTELVADHRTEAFGAAALSGRGPQRDDRRVGQRLPDDRAGLRVLPDNVILTHGVVSSSTGGSATINL